MENPLNLNFAKQVNLICKLFCCELMCCKMQYTIVFLLILFQFNYFCQKCIDPEQLFTKQERIGKGSFGEVFKGIDNRTSEVS